VLANVHKLVNGTHATNYSPITNGDVACYLGIITHYAIIAYEAIMSKMTISHDQAIFSNHRLVPVLGPTVNRYKLTDGGAIANIYVGVFALELQILWNSGNYGTREDPAILSYARAFHDRDVGADPGSITNLYILVDHREWINLHICGQLCIGMNVCMRMNHEQLQKNHAFNVDAAKVIVTAKNEIFFSYIKLKISVYQFKLNCFGKIGFTAVILHPVHTPPDILTLAYKQPPMQEQLLLMHQRDQQMPGSVQYSIRRYSRHPQLQIEDTGMMVYHYQRTEPADNYLELKFCLSGNIYCKQKDTECNMCRSGLSRNCSEKSDSVDVLSFRFSPSLLSQFVKPRHSNSSVGESILNFNHPSSFTKMLPLCGKTRMVIESLLNHNYSDSLENIYINAQVQMLLLYSIDCMIGGKDINTINCKFLTNEADREKIVKARELLIQHIGEPITIKELSRKVAINECYLKKGFKEMFGSTIFDFYQSQRMEHARYLLYEKGMSVTEVSLMLGYSSISHFSTAFKKHTGLKPCELLFR